MALIADTMQKIYHRFLLHTWSVPSILVKISELKKGIHDAEFVATTELLQFFV